MFKFSKTIFFVILLIVAIIFFYPSFIDDSRKENELTLKKAAELGEFATHELMVQIEESQEKLNDIFGRYQMGDIVIIKKTPWPWSEAEKNGFLILKMDLTPKQAELLMKSLKKEESIIASAWKYWADNTQTSETLARRKYAIDLEKIGIDRKKIKKGFLEGIYKWEDVIIEKDVK